MKSPGWQRFQAMVAKEWGTAEGGGSAFLAAISNAAKNQDQDAMAQMRQILVAQREIQKVMQLIPTRVSMLKQGVGPDAYIGSRRGAL